MCFHSHSIAYPYLLVLLKSLPLAVLTLAVIPHLSSLCCLMETLLIFFPGAASLYVYNARIFLAIQHHHSHHSLFLFFGHSMMLLGTAKLQVSSFITHAMWRLPVYWLYISSSHSGHRPRNHSLMRPEKSKKHLSLVYPMISWISWFRLSCVCDINYLNPHLRLLTSLAVWASFGMLSESKTSSFVSRSKQSRWYKFICIKMGTLYTKWSTTVVHKKESAWSELHSSTLDLLELYEGHLVVLSTSSPFLPWQLTVLHTPWLFEVSVLAVGTHFMLLMADRCIH